jgi:hypothetical protein
VTTRTEQLLGILIAVFGVGVLAVGLALTDGTLTWLLASSAVLFVVCGAGLVLNARTRAGQSGLTPHKHR